MTKVWTPQRAANRLVKLAEVFSAAHGVDRFPVEVPPLAREAALIFGWSDPITQVQAANIKGFDGALFSDDGKSEWLLLYNEAMSSAGRVRFTQAHELGHYILHRQDRESFQCSDADMLNWSKDDKDIEGQADLFASYLLMPLDDYRKQVTATVDLDLLGHCADRYGVSLTAAILKWLQYTDEKAVLVMSNDGFINWAWSSEPAAKAGAFFRTRNNVIPVPDRALAANAGIKHDRPGTSVLASTWFPHASAAKHPLRVRPARPSALHALRTWPGSATGADGRPRPASGGQHDRHRISGWPAHPDGIQRAPRRLGVHHRRELGPGARRMSEAPTPTFPDGAKVKIKPLNLIGKIAGFAHVGCNGQMRVLVDRPHGQGVLRQHFAEEDLELVRE